MTRTATLRIADCGLRISDRGLRKSALGLAILVVLVIAVAIFLGIRWYRSRPASGGSGGGTPHPRR